MMTAALAIRSVRYTKVSKFPQCQSNKAMEKIRSTRNSLEGQDLIYHFQQNEKQWIEYI